MSSATINTEEDQPPSPPGWERVEDGKPLLKNDKGEKTLEWCPVCGPEVKFSEVGGQSGYVNRDDHFVRDHEPADFGLGETVAGQLRWSSFEGE